MGKETEGAGLQKKLSVFLKKIVHFLHFKIFSSIIIFMRGNAFLSHSVTIFPLFILVPVILQPAYYWPSEGNCLTSSLGKEAQVQQLLLV